VSLPLNLKGHSIYLSGKGGGALGYLLKSNGIKETRIQGLFIFEVRGGLRKRCLTRGVDGLIGEVPTSIALIAVPLFHGAMVLGVFLEELLGDVVGTDSEVVIMGSIMLLEIIPIQRIKKGFK